MSRHDEEIDEIYSKLKEDVKFCLDLEQADWFGLEIPSEKGLIGPNGWRVEVDAVEVVAGTA